MYYQDRPKKVTRTEDTVDRQADRNNTNNNDEQGESCTARTISYTGAICEGANSTRRKDKRDSRLIKTGQTPDMNQEDEQ